MGGGRRGIVRRSRIRFCKMEWGAAGEGRMNNVMSFRRLFSFVCLLKVGGDGIPVGGWVFCCTAKRIRYTLLAFSFGS